MCELAIQYCFSAPHVLKITRKCFWMPWRFLGSVCHLHTRQWHIRVQGGFKQEKHLSEREDKSTSKILSTGISAIDSCITRPRFPVVPSVHWHALTHDLGATLCVKAIWFNLNKIHEMYLKSSETIEDPQI